MSITVGLRFPKSARRTLRHTRQRILANDLQADVGLFDQALDATERGDSLRVACQNRDEVERMASLFVMLGNPRPTIEDMH